MILPLALALAAAPAQGAPPPAALVAAPALVDWDVDRISIAALDPAVSAEIRPLHSMAAIEKLLRRRKVAFQRQRTTVDPDTLPVAVVREIRALPATEPFALPQDGGGVTISVIVAQRPLPVDARASAALDRLLANAQDDAGDAIARQIVDSLLPALVRGNGADEQRIAAILREEMLAVIRGIQPEMKLQQRRLYLRNFTAAELEEMVRQAEAPLGRKLARLMPGMQAQTFRFGQEASRAAVQAAMPRILERLRAANLITPDAT